MRWHIECRHRGTSIELECAFDEAIRVAQQECQCDWSCLVVWLLPDNLRMAEVKMHGILWIRSTLSGTDVIRLMRRHRMTIDDLSFRLGVSRKRIRAARDHGLTDSLVLRDWLEAIVGEDVGPLPVRYRVQHWTEEGSCAQCGCPIVVGDQAIEYVNEIFCSLTCCRRSRGWSSEVMQ